MPFVHLVFQGQFNNIVPAGRRLPLVPPGVEPFSVAHSCPVPMFAYTFQWLAPVFRRTD
jgi:hypothetical protein